MTSSRVGPRVSPETMSSYFSLTASKIQAPQQKNSKFSEYQEQITDLETVLCDKNLAAFDREIIEEADISVASGVDRVQVTRTGISAMEISHTKARASL